ILLLRYAIRGNGAVLYASLSERGSENLANLERVFTHHLVRVLRVILPLVVAALVVVPAWNYLTRRAEKSGAARRGIQLPKDVSVHTEGFTLSRTEGGRTLFTVHAKSNLGFKDNKGILEDVDVTVYSSTENEPPRTIRSKRATYDQATNDFQFNENVEVQLDANTIVRTSELIYSQRDGTVVSPKPAKIEQMGRIGRADRVEYGLNNGLLKLAGNVKIDTAEHTELQTDSALFNQNDKEATL